MKTARQIDGQVLFKASQFAPCLALNEPPGYILILCGKNSRFIGTLTHTSLYNLLMHTIKE